MIFSQTVIRGPYLQSGTTNSMIVRWRTDTPTNSKVLFGTDLLNLTDSIVNAEILLDHEVFIPGLTPNTKYYYALSDSDGFLVGGTAEYFFKTSPVNGSQEPVRAWILGDCGTGTDPARAVRDAYVNYVGSHHTDLILLLGDNAYDSGLDSEYQEKFFQNMYEDQLIQSVLWPSPGNHDLRSAKSATQSGPYYDIFTVPTNAEAGGLASGTEAYYSFDYANIHFVSLDTDESGHDPTDPMLVWMEDDLHSTEQDWKIVFFHHPPYTKGSHDSDSSSLLIKIRENFVPIWEAAGVDLVLAGHSHSYERSYLIHGHHGFSTSLDSSMILDPGDGQQGGGGVYQKSGTGPDAGAGTVYVVAGSSGKLSGGTFDHPAMFAGFKAMGSVSLEVTGLQLDLKFIDSEGSILDFFTISKREPVGNPPVVSLTSPVDSTQFLSPRNISLVADASDVDGTIEQVEFFANDSLIGTVLAAPYALDWVIPSSGKFKLTARATDNDGNVVTSSRVYIEVGVEVCAQINDGANDAEERPDGGVNTTSSDLELVIDPNHGDQVVGMRFVNLNIPKIAVIDRAYIQFTVDETNNVSPCSLNITGEANGDPLPFMTDDFNITTRSRTSAQVSWTPVDWDRVGQSGEDQQTPDLSPVLQEILNHPEYSDSSAIVLFIDGEGKRVAESFDGSVESAPKLWVNYSVYDCPVQKSNIGDPCDDGDPSTINDTTDANCNCAGIRDTCAAISDVDGDGICTELDCDDNDSTITYQQGDPCDDGDPSTENDMVQSNCICAGSITTCSRVNGSHDDAEEQSDGSVNLTSSDLEMTFDQSDQTVGIRFTNLNIPPGAGIIRASIQFTVDEPNNLDPCMLNIYGEASDDATTFTIDTGDLTNRPKTTASVSWVPMEWLSPGDAGPGQQTIDLSPIIQEIVDREGYSAGSAIAILIDGTGRRVAESYNGSASQAPELCVEYTLGPPRFDCPAIGADFGDPCDDGDSSTIGETIQPDCSCGGGLYPPVVTISDPQDGSFYAVPQSISISADASDTDGIITQVEFFIDGASLQVDSAAPFTVGWMIPSAGSYSITAVATDDDNNITESTPVNIQVGGSLTTTCSKVNSSSDDAEEKPDGSIDLTSSDLELVYDNSDQTVGMRFVGLQIPQGAHINSAHIQFTVEETDGFNPCNLFIYGEASDNAGTFTNGPGDISGRTRTTAFTSWSPPDWQVVGEAGPPQKTADIAAIIQEIVNRREYTSSSAIVIIIDGSGKRSGESYDGSASKAPELCVEYTPATQSVKISEAIDFRNRLEKEPMEPVATGVDLTFSERVLSPISVYPNPANRDLTVELWSAQKDNVRVQIVDLVGRTRYSHLWQVSKGSNQITLNSLTLETGIYMVQLFLNDSYQSSKVVISR